MTPCTHCNGRGYTTEDPLPHCPGFGYEEHDCRHCDGTGEDANADALVPSLLVAAAFTLRMRRAMAAEVRT